MRRECDETYYQEAKGRTSWDPTSKQCLKSSSITIAGSQGSPMRIQCLLGGGTALHSVHFILQPLCIPRASNAVAGPRHAYGEQDG